MIYIWTIWQECPGNGTPGCDKIWKLPQTSSDLEMDDSPGVPENPFGDPIAGLLPAVVSRLVFGAAKERGQSGRGKIKAVAQKRIAAVLTFLFAMFFLSECRVQIGSSGLRSPR